MELLVGPTVCKLASGREKCPLTVADSQMFSGLRSAAEVRTRKCWPTLSNGARGQVGRIFYFYVYIHFSQIIQDEKLPHPPLVPPA